MAQNVFFLYINKFTRYHYKTYKDSNIYLLSRLFTIIKIYCIFIYFFTFFFIFSQKGVTFYVK